MSTNSEKPETLVSDEIAATDAASLSIPVTGVKTPAAADAQKPKKKLLRSIRVRTITINIAYAVAVIIILWSCFFVYLFGFYGGQLRDEIGKLGTQISQMFPYRIDDKAFERYNEVLSAAARSQMVSFSVFTKTPDGEYNVILNIDTFGNNIEHGTEAFDTFMTQLASEDLWHGDVHTIGTRIGSFVCYCDTNDIATPAGADTAYLLIIKPYQLFSPTVVSIIYVLVGCSIIALGLAVVSSFILSRSQTKRIKDISTKAKMLAGGDFNVEFSDGGCDEYVDLANALNLAAAEMNKTEALRRDVIANVSHDIRTPLTMIRGYAEMLRDMPLDAEKRKRTANVIIEETDRLNTLSGDVLSLSKLQAGVVDFNYERVNISKLAKVTLAKFDIFSTRDGIVFECDVDDDVYAVCDAQRIMQVLYNFIGNAVNYCGDDKTVTLSVKRTGDGALVRIGDHGNGIAPDELDIVWTRYYRAAQKKRTAVGTGLGLSICKNILDSHGAKYAVESELGKGTVFSFELKDEQNNETAGSE